MRHLPPIVDPNVLVGINTGDDAAVYRMSDDLALVQTVDFFPPIVDDPYTYGVVAAANSISDIYAMGARPILALNIVAFPVSLPKTILQEILRGGAEKALEAGVIIVGGHTVDDAEPKYGMAVTGVVKPGKQITNAGAKPGDILILTKPLGTGIITTAGKAQKVEEAVLQDAIRHMSTLNKAAAEAAVEVGVNACTDITGFGLIGHLRGMMEASGAAATVHYDQVPLIPGAWELTAERDIFPGGLDRNRSYLDRFVGWDKGLHPLAYRMLYDPQTSGGLLFSAPPDRVDRLVEALSSRGVGTIAIIGEVLKDGRGTIRVVP